MIPSHTIAEHTSLMVSLAFGWLLMHHPVDLLSSRNNFRWLPSKWFQRLRRLSLTCLLSTSTQISLPSKPENLSIVLRNSPWECVVRALSLLHVFPYFSLSLMRVFSPSETKSFVINYSHASSSFMCGTSPRSAASIQLRLIRNNKRNFYGGEFFALMPHCAVLTRVLMKNVKRNPFPQKPKHTRPKDPTTKQLRPPYPAHSTLPGCQLFEFLLIAVLMCWKRKVLDPFNMRGCERFSNAMPIR